MWDKYVRKEMSKLQGISLLENNKAGTTSFSSSIERIIDNYRKTLTVPKLSFYEINEISSIYSDIDSPDEFLNNRLRIRREELIAFYQHVNKENLLDEHRLGEWIKGELNILNKCKAVHELPHRGRTVYKYMKILDPNLRLSIYELIYIYGIFEEDNSKDYITLSSWVSNITQIYVQIRELLSNSWKQPSINWTESDSLCLIWNQQNRELRFYIETSQVVYMTFYTNVQMQVDNTSGEISLPIEDYGIVSEDELDGLVPLYKWLMEE